MTLTPNAGLHPICIAYQGLVLGGSAVVPAVPVPVLMYGRQQYRYGSWLGVPVEPEAEVEHTFLVLFFILFTPVVM